MYAYLDLVGEVLDTGHRKENRTGIDTKSLFGQHYTIDLNPLRMHAGSDEPGNTDQFPLLTTKHVEWSNVLLENLWFLSGETSLDFLHHYGVKFWDPWMDERGHVTAGYGPEWRRSGERIAMIGGPTVITAGFDQIQWVISELIRNPMSRRLVVDAWDPIRATNEKLPPCHYSFVLNVQNEALIHSDCESNRKSIDSDTGADAEDLTLNMHVTQRSADLGLGVPYNMAGYAFLLALFSRFSNIPVGRLSHTLVDAHVYVKSIDGRNEEYDHEAGLREQLKRRPRTLPTLTIDPSIRRLEDVEALIVSRPPIEKLLGIFKISNYNPHPAIKLKVAV